MLTVFMLGDGQGAGGDYLLVVKLSWNRIGQAKVLKWVVNYSGGGGYDGGLVDARSRMDFRN